MSRLCILSVWFIAGATFVNGAFVSSTNRTAPPSVKHPITLNVGIYPYVPRIEQFKQVFNDLWKRKDIKVTFDDTWDGGYGMDPNISTLDIFVFDGIFLDYFVQKGFLKEISLTDVNDFKDLVPYGIEGVKVDGKLYAIPQIGCGAILFYRMGDTRIENAHSLRSLVKEVGQCTISAEKPPRNKGLMIDLSGGTTSAAYYLDAVMDVNGNYTPKPFLAKPPSLQCKAIRNLHAVVRMAGVRQVNYEPTVAYQRAAWFAQGFGRATVGFTESLEAMGPEAENVTFKLLPLADRSNVDLFYTDAVGISSAIVGRERQRAALTVANFISSTRYLEGAFGASKSDPIPQYLLPVRKSVMNNLAGKYKTYNRLRRLFRSTSPKPFRIGPRSRQWLENYKDRIQKAIVPDWVCERKPAPGDACYS